MASGKGASVLTYTAITQKRQSYEQAKSYNNYFSMVITLVEMANCLPFETEYNGKKWREFVDAEIAKSVPKAIFDNDVLQIKDKQEVKRWIFKYAAIIERTCQDYVNSFYRRGAARSAL
jgi:hypothetical protein